MNSEITILAPAKINVYLDVLGKRSDGYHDIETLMQTVGVFDRLNVIKNDGHGAEREIAVFCDGNIPGGEDNLAYKAALSFFSEMGDESYNVSISIEKRIPDKAGLGGGSSDAAATIIALSHLYHPDTSIERLMEIGALVGSDVPFLVKKGTCIGTGRGEVIESCTPFPDCVIVIAVPTSERVSTAQAYSIIDGISDKGSLEKMKRALLDCSIESIGAAMFNKFEYIFSDGSKIKEVIKKLSSISNGAARMSGSGSAVFALFSDPQSAKNAADELSRECEVFLCRPVRSTYNYIEN